MRRKTIVAGLIIFACLGIFAGCKPKQVEEEKYVPKKYGDFYTPEEAYDQGLLTVEDLKKIAYYQNGERSDDPDFEPKPKDPEELSKEIQRAIRERKAYELRNQKHPIEDASAELIHIKNITVLITDVLQNWRAPRYSEFCAHS